MEIRAERLLLVEGKDESNLLKKLIEDRFNHEFVTIQVISAGGHTNFRRNLKTIRDAARSGPPLRTIGIVRDADEDPAAGFQSVRDSVVSVGFEPPPRHAAFSTGNPSIGIFIAPDGENEGAIETVCRRSLEGKAATGCVEDYLDCLKQRGALLSTNEDKTFAHAYLAAMRDPMVRVGEAALNDIWDFQDQAFSGLVQFVRQLGSPRQDP